MINHGLISRLYPLDNLKYSKLYSLSFSLKTVALESPSAWKQSLPLNTSGLNAFFTNLPLTAIKYLRVTIDPLWVQTLLADQNTYSFNLYLTHILLLGLLGHIIVFAFT